MKSVLISIRPQWCELIASGRKTIEVRKTRPKLETPFKCYIYCTKPQKRLRYVWTKADYEGYPGAEELPDDLKVFCKIPDGSYPFCSPPYSGKVIGEFVCDEIIPIRAKYTGSWGDDCLSDDERKRYLGSERGWAWHISDLKIYDKPMELCALKRWNRTEENSPCAHVKALYEPCETCKECNLKRPPQSWCYLEEVPTHDH